MTPAELAKLIAPLLPEWVITCITFLPLIVMAASAIAAMTPTPHDDILIGKLYKLIDVLALNVGKAKQDCPHTQKVEQGLQDIPQMQEEKKDI
jgi:hypothetical protein